jgi:RNA polymerase sigma-70 factor (ECF subfamily)
VEARTRGNSLTDRELLESYLAGDVSAFEAILGRYEKPLLRFLARCRAGMGQDGAREWAQDTVQEVFLRLIHQARELQQVDNLSAWLFRVARNLTIDEARKEIRMERRHQVVASAQAAFELPPDEERREIADIVTENLEELPAGQKAVLVLKIQEGKSYKEIAEITGLTISNVGYLIHHGLKNLGGRLRAAGVV